MRKRFADASDKQQKTIAMYWNAFVLQRTSKMCVIILLRTARSVICCKHAATARLAALKV